MKKALVYLVLAVMTVFLPHMIFAQGAGNMLNFGDNTDKVEVADADALDVGTGNFTIEAWIKLTTCNSWGVIAEKGESNIWFNNSYSFGINHTGNHIRFKGNWSGGVELDSDISLDLNKWYHVVGVRDGNNAYIYINGIKDINENNSCSGGAETDGKKLMIGSDAPSQYLDGSMDELRIWNVARTESQIRYWMHKTDGLLSQTGLVSVWHFNESTVGASSVIDSKGGYNGTPVNMVNADCATSTAAIGDKSNIGTGNNNLGEIVDVTVDITWYGADDYPGTDAIFSAIQVNESPSISTGLLAHYAGMYWELWMANDDGTYKADVKLHYDDVTTINDESNLRVYTRTDATGSWSAVSSYSIHDGGNNTDGQGYIKVLGLTGPGFKQFIITSSTNSALPIELLDFTVNKKSENSVIIKWQTASEINNDYFIVQRSTDVKNWENIVEVKGAGNSNEILDYVEYYNNLYNGVSYYKLKQVDFDGKYSYSNIVTVNSLSQNKSNFTIYPNPTNGLITISNLTSSVDQEGLNIEVINHIGKVVKQFKTQNPKLVIQISDLQKGLYFIKITSSTDTVVKKIVLD